MKLLATLIIAIFLIAGFNLATMDHHNVCPFDPSLISDCTLVQNPFTSVASHLNGFSHLSLSMMLAVIFLSTIFFAFARIDFLNLLRFFHQRSAIFIPIAEQSMRYWFSLHENSPALNFRRR